MRKYQNYEIQISADLIYLINSFKFTVFKVSKTKLKLAQTCSNTIWIQRLDISKCLNKQKTIRNK